jgi:Glycosyl hydrolase family 67 N-terminus
MDLTRRAFIASSLAGTAEDLLDDNLIVGTQANSALIRDLNWSADLSAVGDQGYIIRSARIGNGSVTVIAANTELGALYGSFHFLRLMQTGQRIDKLEIAERPALQLRDPHQLHRDFTAASVVVDQLETGIGCAAGNDPEGFPNTVNSMIPSGAVRGQLSIVSRTKRHFVGGISAKMVLRTILFAD